MPLGLERLNSFNSLKDACTHLNKLQERDVSLWNNTIGLHAKNDRSTKAFQLFQQMQQESVLPNDATLVHVLTAHARHNSLYEAKRLHSCVSNDAIESNPVMGSTLVTMYGRLGRLELAESLFPHLKHEDIALWNAMINAYAQNGKDNHVLQLFYLMQTTELAADKVTYACVLRACSRLQDLEDGRLIHTFVMCTEMDCPSIVATTLISMYGKCNSLEDAQSLFSKLADREVATWNSMIAVLVGREKGEEGLFLFYRMHQEAVFPDRATFVSVLGALSSDSVLSEGKRMHAYIAACGFLCDKVVTTALFDMYGSCGSMEDAEHLFEGMVERTEVSWNAILSELVQNKCGRRAFELFERMLWEGQIPNKVTYLNMLFACTLEDTFMQGTVLHLQILNRGYESNMAVATAIVAMYGRFGNLEYARRVFDTMHERNIVSWDSMLKVYVDFGHMANVFLLLGQLKQEGFLPIDSMLSSSLSVCSSAADLVFGKQLHVCVFALQKPESEPVLSDALINMYIKCDSLHDALIISKRTLQKDVSSWNVLIEAFAQKEDRILAFQMFFQMWNEGVLPNKGTHISILEACNSSSDHRRCVELHTCIAHGELKQDTTIASALIKGYGSCGDLEQAKTVFNSVSNRDTVLWNTMLRVYYHEGLFVLSLQLFDQMHQEGELPTSITYVSLFSGCARSRSLVEGKRLHSVVRHCREFELDIPLMNSLVSMYGRCGQPDISERLFFDMPQRSRVSWSGMIAIYTELEYSDKALELFYWMVNQEGILPDKITLLCAVSACASSALLVEGRELHNLIVMLGFDADTEVANSLANMYGKCGKLKDAWALFLCHSTKSTCSWNTMIGLLLNHGHDINAVQLFKQMQQEGVFPCEFTYASVLSACGNLASLTTGRLVCFSIACNQVESTMTMDNLIISMYGKCGSLEDASWQFNRLSAGNPVSWNTMLASYAQHGRVDKALKLLDLMHGATSPPDEVSFLTAVSACSHTGLVDTGCNLWILMCHDLRITPGSKHYACLVDVFSRAGRVADAKQLITHMPNQPCSASWTAFLSACRDHAIEEQAFEVAPYLIEMDRDESSTYVMLSNIHVAANLACSMGT